MSKPSYEMKAKTMIGIALPVPVEKNIIPPKHNPPSYAFTHIRTKVEPLHSAF
jgi:hypothetical protein